jgi:hypothetical protein
MLFENLHSDLFRGACEYFDAGDRDSLGVTCQAHRKNAPLVVTDF